VPTSVFQIPAGWGVDRYGVKFPYAFCFLLWSLASAFTSLVTTTTQLFSLRLLLGLGEAAVAPASTRWIRFHFAERDRGFALSLYIIGVHVGLAAGAPLMAWLVSAYGWRCMYAILGLGGVIWLVPWLALVRDGVSSLDVETQEKTSALSLRRVIKSRVFAGLVAGTFANNYFLLLHDLDASLSG